MPAAPRPLTVLRTIVLPLMTPPLLAGIALCFVSCLGNFGIPALLGIPGNYLVLPTLIYQRLAGLGPGVLSEVAVLSVLIGAIARDRHRRAGSCCCAGATFAPRGDGRPRARSSCGAGACPSRSRCGRSSSLVLVLPLLALVLTSLVPAVGVPLDVATATLDNYRFVLFEHAAARRALRQQLRPVGDCGHRDRADRRCRSRISSSGGAIAAAARGQPRHRDAVRGARRRARDRGDPAVPEAAAAARRVALQHGLDHPVLLSRALPRARLAARWSAAITSSTARSRRRRRSPARGCCGACARSSCRWSRRPRPPARCSSS